VIDGCENDCVIANKFAHLFQNACSPNSLASNVRLKKEYLIYKSHYFSNTDVSTDDDATLDIEIISRQLFKSVLFTRSQH